MSKIITAYDPKPIPARRFDWSAVDENYEPGCPIGWGRTEQEAIDDLLNENEELRFMTETGIAP